MRTVLTVALTLIAVAAITAEAKAAPWCAVYGNFGATNCGFYSRQQCMAAISGNGGYCTPNYADDRRSDRSSRGPYR